MSTHSISHLLNLHPVVAASIAEDWANDVRYLAEAQVAISTAYAALNGPMMIRDRNHYWESFKAAERTYAERLSGASRLARRIAYAADWYRF